MDVTAIIPSYGRLDLTAAAVERLRRQSAPPAHVIVVDDGFREPFSHHPGVEILRHPTNRGFAAAVNSGFRAAATPLLAVLNNDVTLSDDWLERLGGLFTHSNIPFACGKIFRPDGLLDGTWDLLCRGGLAWRAGAGRRDSGLWNEKRIVALTSFTAVVINRDAVRTAGELDESFETYYEDVEWSLRNALGNRRGVYCPEATSVHLGSATTGSWSAYATRQLLRNHRRIAHQYLLPRYRNEYRIARTLFRALCLRHGQWPDVPKEPVIPRPVNESLDGLLRESEQQIAELQEETGWNSLWRAYFRLTGP